MFHRTKARKLAAAILILTGTISGQTPPAGAPPDAGRGGRGTGRGSRGAGGGTPVSALVSPDVHPDRTVTFRFRAAQATDVQLVGEIMQGKGPQPMTKDDAGIWTTTIGPVPPEIW